MTFIPGRVLLLAVLATCTNAFVVAPVRPVVAQTVRPPAIARAPEPQANAIAAAAICPVFVRRVLLSFSVPIVATAWAQSVRALSRRMSHTAILAEIAQHDCLETQDEAVCEAYEKKNWWNKMVDSDLRECPRALNARPALARSAFSPAPSVPHAGMTLSARRRTTTPVLSDS